MDQTLRSDKAMSLIASQLLSQLLTLCFTLHFCKSLHCIKLLSDGPVFRNPKFLPCSISNQLAAVGSTIQPNCSFSIFCLFSDCQNTRMCNQGWVLDEARQICQHCRPSLLCGSDATEVYFLHFVWVLKMEESVTLN